jgi:hypothetical protein
VFFSWDYKQYPYFAIKHPTVFLANLGVNVLNTLSFTAFLALVISVRRQAVSQIRKRKIEFDSRTLIVLISSLSILQLYPASDPLHFWWLTPLFIVGALSALEVHTVPIYAEKVLSLALVFFIVICLANFIHYSSAKKTNYRSEILGGMTGSPQEVRYIDETLAMLDAVPLRASIKFDCNDGLYSIVNGRYRARDKNFVNWAPGFSKSDLKFDFIFQCNVPRENNRLENYRILNSIPIRLGHTGIPNGLENRLLKEIGG